MTDKKNYSTQWRDAREIRAVQQGSVLCTWARVYAPVYDIMNEYIKPIFSFQHGAFDFTVIQDDPIAELAWMDSIGGYTSPWGQLHIQRKGGRYAYSYNEILGDKNFFNPTTLHVGRLTDASIEYLIKNSKNLDIIAYIQKTPYILYRPMQWRWDKIRGEDNSDYDYQPKKNNILPLLLGSVASCYMLNL